MRRDAFGADGLTGFGFAPHMTEDASAAILDDQLIKRRSFRGGVSARSELKFVMPGTRPGMTVESNSLIWNALIRRHQLE